jgi:hypothetical protein
MITFRQLRKRLLKEEESEAGEVALEGDGIENFSYDETTEFEDDFSNKSIHHQSPKKQKASQQNNRVRYMSFHHMKPGQKAPPQKRGGKGKGRKANRARLKKKK